MPAKILMSVCFLFAATQAPASPLEPLSGADYLVYESGNVAARPFIGVRPSLSGRLSVPPGTASGQIALSFQSGRIGVKCDLGSDRHIEFSAGTLWGVDTAFPAGPFRYSAEFDLNPALGDIFGVSWSGGLLFSKMGDGGTTSFPTPSSCGKNVTLALRHETGKAIHGLGVQYSWISYSQTVVPTLFGPAPASFNGNKALAMVVDGKFRF